MLSKILTILRKISKIIAENDDQSQVLDEIVKVLSKNLDADVCSIYVYDDEESELLLTATCGLNPDLVGKVRLKPGRGDNRHRLQGRRDHKHCKSGKTSQIQVRERFWRGKVQVVPCRSPDSRGEMRGCFESSEYWQYAFLSFNYGRGQVCLHADSQSYH